MNPTAPKLRAPRVQLAGCAWLARLADKIRLHATTQLPEDYSRFLGHKRGVDGHFLKHFGLEMEPVQREIAALPDDAAVAAWFLAQPDVTDSSIASWNALAPNIGRQGQPGEREFHWMVNYVFQSTPAALGISSTFEAIEMDEGHKFQQGLK